MNRRPEPCRNFQRGSCQYGDRCKFLHVTQQQSKSNPFGFGSQSFYKSSQTSQQSKPNQFGFGVQNASQLSGATNFDFRNQSQSKPFENKWIRQTGATNSTISQHADNKQAVEHECTDPEACKRQIAEDLKNEFPMWKLTCYGHWKYLPCDIIGDVSYEELRASAYEDAKRGLPLQSSVERERNMLNSKLCEFDNLLRNPYVIKSSGPIGVNQFPLSSTTSLSPLSNKPHTFSSFSQLGASATVVPNKSFGNQLPGRSSNTVFGQPNIPKTANQNSGLFGVQEQFQQFQSSHGPSNSGFINGTVSGQVPMQQFGSSTRPSNPGFTNNFMAFGSNQSPLQYNSPQFLSSNANQSAGWGKVGQSTVNQATTVEKQDVTADDTIWSKMWDIGEIPEEEPPDSVCIDIVNPTFVR